jgi:hypothetical protein
VRKTIVVFTKKIYQSETGDLQREGIFEKKEKDRSAKAEAMNLSRITK